MVIKEDEEMDDGEETSVEDDEPINPLVNALFDEVEELRMQVSCLSTATSFIVELMKTVGGLALRCTPPLCTHRG